MPAPFTEDTVDAGLWLVDPPQALRQEALRLHRSFAPMAPVLRSARRLSLNAEAVCSRMGPAAAMLNTVTRELRPLTEEIGRLVDEIEELFTAVAGAVAGWAAADAEAACWRAALVQVRQVSDRPAPGRWPDPLTPGAGRIWQACARDAAASPTERRLWRALLGTRERQLRALRAVVELARRLTSLVDRVRWVAVRQSGYVSVLAAIEGSRVADPEGEVAAVLDALRRLNAEVAVVEATASQQVHALGHLAGRIVQRTMGAVGAEVD